MEYRRRRRRRRSMELDYLGFPVLSAADCLLFFVVAWDSILKLWLLR